MSIMAGKAWTCPYCNRVATLQSANISIDNHTFNNNNRYGSHTIRTTVVVCPNEECREVCIAASLHKYEKTPHGYQTNEEVVRYWPMKPDSNAKPMPSYIPEVIVSDYNEACAIRDLSPKASATLSRRCLQGIIRDFWGVSKSRLIDEINELEGKLDGTTWKAIDAVRSIGNIGAHMEKDISVIIDVDPEEAGLLIGLIEVLIDEWYVHRHEREEHMNKVIAAAKSKRP